MDIIKDKSISLKAKGVFFVIYCICSKSCNIIDIANICGESSQTVSKYIKELLDSKYIFKKIERTHENKVEVRWTINPENQFNKKIDEREYHMYKKGYCHGYSHGERHSGEFDMVFDWFTNEKEDHPMKKRITEIFLEEVL